jgi:hypothetical protein
MDLGQGQNWGCSAKGKEKRSLEDIIEVDLKEIG